MPCWGKSVCANLGWAVQQETDRLLQETDRLLVGSGIELPSHERKQLFNQILLDLENDFYIIEVKSRGNL